MMTMMMMKMIVVVVVIDVPGFVVDNSDSIFNSNIYIFKFSFFLCYLGRW